jgi:RNA polymerase sigma-70 factor (ECF subfamily)
MKKEDAASPASGTGAVRPRNEVKVLGFPGDDAELLRRLQTNPRGGAALLHDRFASEVNRLVWRILGADADHDDLVQQVFYQLITSVHRVREPEKLRGWVQTVTVNAVYSELRKRGVRRLFLAGQAHEPERFVDVSSSLESRELLRHIHEVLEQMPAGERVVFSLRYIEERPLKEVAELCDCSLATAKRRLQKANKRFSKFAEKHPELSKRISARAGADDSEDEL